MPSKEEEEEEEKKKKKKKRRRRRYCSGEKRGSYLGRVQEFP